MRVSIILSLYNVEKYLETYFEDALKQTIINEIEFSIIHNNPTELEKLVIDKYKNKLNIIYQEVLLEPLYISWNKAITQSTGKYLACWNVDDLRTYNSIERMVETLDQNLNIGFTYGDIIIVNKFSNKQGNYIKTPAFTNNLGTTGAIGGPFFMWRRSLNEKVGVFDEQFKSGGDFDYTVRLSIFSQGKKTAGIIGYFLNEKLGLSTKNADLQIVERTVIEMRYGIWYKIDIDYICKAFDYQINHIMENGISRKIDSEIAALNQKRKYWMLMIGFGFIKNSTIKILQKIKRYLTK